MKYNLQIINDINRKVYIPDILATERNELIPHYDFNTHCVAHKDESPSLRVYLEHGRGCYCFSCGHSFTPYKVMKLLTGLSYSEIIQKFVDNYGYTVPTDFKDDKDYSIDHKYMAMQINQIKPYLNKKTMDLLNKSISADFKNGNHRYINKLHEAIISKFEGDYI